MKSKIYFYTKILMPVIFLVTGISVSAKSTIQKLTSKETATKAAPKITSSSDIHKHSIGIGIGQTFLGGAFSKTGQNKITMDLFYNYSASYSFDLLVNAHHSRQSFGGTYTQLTSLNMGIKSKFYQIDNFSPFAVAGLGFYAPKTKRLVGTQYLESKTILVFGYNLGLGGDLKLNDKITMGVYGVYHNPFDVKQEIGSSVVGRYYKLLITAFYTFN